MAATRDDNSVTMDELRVGLFVQLDLKWFEHPFAFNAFRIKNEEQIKTLRSLGLKRVRYDPSRSEAATVEAPAPEPSPPQELLEALAAKRALIERIRRQREISARVETAFVDTAKTIRGIEKDLLAKPEETVRAAEELVDKIVSSILDAPELAIHVMSDMLGGEEMYFHSLNVTMLSLMVARDIKLPTEVVSSLGLGALFHDVGRREIPAKVLMKTEPWSQAERRLYELHCEYGVAIGRKLGFNPAALSIIAEHHEFYDGSGYPKRLKADTIGLLSRIVAIANHYDGLCNPVNIANAMTPHEALSQMFAHQRGLFDPKLLQVFIRCLGVYPPGTIVQLANGLIGMVATINTAQPMKPMIVVYDAQVPKDEAILVDMAHDMDTNIAKAIRPAQVPREIYNYLSPRQQVSYYFDADNPRHDGGHP
jgi:putative nucleotidyltransferase with HDIG domain